MSTERNASPADEPQTFTPPVGLPPRAKRTHIHLPARHNAKLQQVLETVQADEELYALWHAQNVNAVTRLGMSDHGPVHMQIVANLALHLLRLLVKHGVTPSAVKDHGMDYDDAEVIVTLAALLHDIGMSIHRANHEEYSLIIADRKLPGLLAPAYPDVGLRTLVQSDILHAIIAHRAGGRPFTLEAGIVRVADALDMAKGRSRIPFEQGEINIHSVSAMAVESVQVEEGEKKPIRVHIILRNSAGIFQVDSLLKEKLKGSGLEPYIEVLAESTGHEEPLVRIFEI
ncbi:MAG: HD domain-containing protein [Chloroflexi bacterium]|nr:HD domain-containing protein [Chloroflexota bacterium]